MTAEGAVELADAPRDGVSQVSFAPGDAASLLLAGSWDSHLYLYDADANKRLARVPMDAALLAVAWGKDARTAYAGGLQRQVVRLDVPEMRPQLLGTHDDAVRCLSQCASSGLLFSGSWDATAAAWDARQKAPRVARLPLPDKAYAMDAHGGRLIVASAGRAVTVWDTRRLDAPLQRRESSLRFQTRALAATRGGGLAPGYVCASVEGRVAVDVLDPAPAAQAAKYAFKCHRARASAAEEVYPVNAVAVHPTHGTFATGGADGVVAAWDGVARKRLRAHPRLPAGVSSLSFSADGTRLAVASSYAWENGPQDHAPDAIYVRRLAPDEMRPRSSRE